MSYLGNSTTTILSSETRINRIFCIKKVIKIAFVPETGEGRDDVVCFTLDLSSRINHANKGENSLENVDDFVTNAVTGLGLVVHFATEAVVPVRV
jgi:hypothetical protein